jgi:hypothetical protein
MYIVQPSTLINIFHRKSCLILPKELYYFAKKKSFFIFNDINK